MIDNYQREKKNIGTIFIFFYFSIFQFSVNSQLMSNIISQLMGTTNSVMQLHQRLKNTDESSNGTDNRKQEMLKELENAVMMTQSMLTKITSKYAKLPFKSD